MTDQLNLDVDVFGNQPALGIYTQIALIYAFPEGQSTTNTVDALTRGLSSLSKTFPWIAGQVVAEHTDEGPTGHRKIRSWRATPPLTVKDYRDDESKPSLSDLREARYPFRLLDESWIAARNTIPGSSGEAVPKESPCLLVQATFIRGGLILTFNGQHQVMDGVGQYVVVRLLNKACNGEAFTEDELLAGNLERGNLVPFFGPEWQPTGELASRVGKEADFTPSSDETPPEVPKSSWAYFEFSGSSLAGLKSKATKSKSPDCDFVSSDDALTAFIWQSISRARAVRLSEADKQQQFHLARAVDVRHVFNVSSNYPGMLQNMTYFASPVGTLPSSPLGKVASQLRAAVDPKTSTLEYDTIALATVQERMGADKVSFMQGFNVDLAVLLSSWGRINCSNMDFGMGLGGPEAFRRPQFIPFPGLVYLLPKGKQGEVVVAISLRDDDMEQLKADEEFMKHAQYIP